MKNKAIYEEVSVRNPGKFILFYSSDQTLPCYLHRHNEIEFLFFEGPGAMNLGGDSIKVEKNSFITVNRNELHSVEKGKYASLVLCDSFFTGTNFPENTSFTKQIENDYLIINTFQNLSYEYKSEEPGFDMQIKGIVYNLLTYLLRNYKCQGIQSLQICEKKSSSALVSKIINHIDKNYYTTLSTAELAKEFHITVNHLCHIFKAHTGYTPIEYINNRRIEKSTRLLNNKDKTITEVAQAVGFENSSYYTKVFKRHMGVTPTEYRNYQQA